jgi:hypothetical protein
MILFLGDVILSGSQAGGKKFGEPGASPSSTSGLAVELEG